MERGELCHDRDMVLLLEERMQDIGTAKPNVRGAMIQALDLSPGFGDCKTIGIMRILLKHNFKARLFRLRTLSE